MTERKLHHLGFGPKLLLAAVGFTSVAAPIAFGLASTALGNTGPQATSVIEHASETSAMASGTRDQISPKAAEVLLVKKVNPVYPQAAKDAHIQGPVVLQAVIGKEGDIENLQIVSGHPQLAQAAIEAVKQWKFRPYLKNGQAAEVETKIEVNFTLSE